MNPAIFFVGQQILYTFKTHDGATHTYPGIITGIEDPEDFEVNLTVFVDHHVAGTTQELHPTSVPFHADMKVGTWMPIPQYSTITNEQAPVSSKKKAKK